jgi:hypothetical protein
MSPRACLVFAYSLLPLLIGGCAASGQLSASQPHAGQWVGGHLPQWAGGEPANVPRPHATDSAYPQVFEARPQRRAKLLTAQEQEQLQRELKATRNRVLAQTKPAARPEKAGLAKEHRPETSEHTPGGGLAVAAAN